MEEAWDLAAAMGGYVRSTPFPGVYLIMGNEIARYDNILDVVRDYRFSFASRLVIPKVCASIGGADVESLIASRLASSRIQSPVRLIVALRGKSKKYIKKDIILSKLNIILNRNSSFVVDIEGIDDLVLASWGYARRCGYGCLLVGYDTEI
ncbi:MAG: hypothetical protein F7C38_08230 [Desulfurococcales archaeon]|nr:hypothetical protein [Desulfurococcales archaeon]